MKKNKNQLLVTFFAISLLLSCPAHSSDVHLKLSNGEWSLLVDGQPYFIRGVSYRVSKVGQSPDERTASDWAYYDYDRNGRVDGPYDAWIDFNQNDRRDPNEVAVGDFELMKRMGVNTIRWYVNAFEKQRPNKELLRDLFHNYGIRVAVGNKFGAYAIDSGARWDRGTDYTSFRQRQRLLESVQRMVLEHKDEPYTLLWLLGNENNYSFTNTNASKNPIAYATLLNEAAELIHRLDGQHPVALVNGDIDHLDIYKKHCPQIDIIGTNAYRGSLGFGRMWKEAKEKWDRPILVTEFGGSYAAEDGEASQMEYHLNAWRDIEANSKLADGGMGNSLGGFAYAWLDEWWKAGEPDRQARQYTNGRQGGQNMSWSQEYCGIMTQGSGSHSPFLRRPRLVYFGYQRLWQKD